MNIRFVSIPIQSNQGKHKARAEKRPHLINLVQVWVKKKKKTSCDFSNNYKQLYMKSFQEP